MQVNVMFSDKDAKKVHNYAIEKRLSMSASIRLLVIERLNQLEGK